jgi:hypothetical protein
MVSMLGALKPRRKDSKDDDRDVSNLLAVIVLSTDLPRRHDDK